MKDKEQWKSIPESDDYLISNYGRMMKKPKGLLLKPQYMQKGKESECDWAYYVIHSANIHNKKHLLRRAISVCVMRAFRPDEYVEGKPLYRIDNDVHNNYVDNFYYENKNAKAALNKRKLLFEKLRSKGDWDIRGDITDARNFVLATHIKCGEQQRTTVAHICKLGAPRCHYCNQVANNNKRLPSINKVMQERTVGRFSIVGAMTLADAPATIFDAKYGRTFVTNKANTFMRSNAAFRSPYDYKFQSVGEAMIEYLLALNKDDFYWQYYFNDCRNILPLPFDFAIMNEVGKVKYLIEYQGAQHYQEASYFDETLEERARVDRIKQDYCSLHHLPLLLLSGEDYADMNNQIIDYDKNN